MQRGWSGQKPRPNSLKALLQRQARRRKLQEAEAQLEESDLRRIVQLLEEQAVLGRGGEADPRINYDGFAQARGCVATECLASFGPQVGPFFQASTFLQFERDGDGAVSLPLLVQYLTQHANAMQLRAQLCPYDAEGTGELDAQQLEDYLKDVAQENPLLGGMEPSFLPHYTRIAARKLLFFHGRQRAKRGRMSVRLSDLMVSPVMMELQELRALGLAIAAEGGPPAPDERDLSSNWFSLQSAQRVYTTFHTWDADGSGTLSRAEFSRISQGTMSELFIGRVFEEHAAAPRGDVWPPPPPGAAQACGEQPGGGGGGSGARGPGSPDGLPRLGLRVRTPTGSGAGGGSPPPPGQDGGAGGEQAEQQQRRRGARQPAPGACARDEMDMMAFVDFVLAWDHRNHPAALPYFFSIFDLRHKGYLTHSDLYTFFREIHAMWVAMGEYADLVIHDVLDEIVDMAAPRRQGAITAADLRDCKMAGTVFSILANVDQFYQYNYRENFMHSDGGEGGGQAGGG
ncbi:MAG: hypothetical protein J3K34DRAFT_498330 [Monoraphidium minutum]|nr:MAG: hypothetical protein J3K34DRAFT_498330 [Monoraphidium minutum]